VRAFGFGRLAQCVVLGRRGRFVICNAVPAPLFCLSVKTAFLLVRSLPLLFQSFLSVLRVPKCGWLILPFSFLGSEEKMCEGCFVPVLWILLCPLGQSPDVGNLLSQMWLILLYHFRIWKEEEGRAVGLVD
jgi:hypothetical protein